MALRRLVVADLGVAAYRVVVAVPPHPYREAVGVTCTLDGAPVVTGSAWVGHRCPSCDRWLVACERCVLALPTPAARRKLTDEERASAAQVRLATGHGCTGRRDAA